MVHPPSKFAGVEVFGWNDNHVKFSCLVKFAFWYLLPLNWELRCHWFEHGGFVSLEQHCQISLAEFVDIQQSCTDVITLINLAADGWELV